MWNETNATRSQSRPISRPTLFNHPFLIGCPSYWTSFSSVGNFPVKLDVSISIRGVLRRGLTILQTSKRLRRICPSSRMIYDILALPERPDYRPNHRKHNNHEVVADWMKSSYGNEPKGYKDTYHNYQSLQTQYFAMSGFIVTVRSLKTLESKMCGQNQ